jgi:type I restriction enzyme M protein
MAKKTQKELEEPLEKKLWKTADKLRKNMDAAEFIYITMQSKNFLFFSVVGSF